MGSLLWEKLKMNQAEQDVAINSGLRPSLWHSTLDKVMAIKPPVIGQLSILALFPLVLLYFVGMGIARHFGLDPFWGIVGVLVLFFTVRSVVPRKHRKAISLMKKNEYKAAVPFFRASYDFFSRCRWLDRYRWLFILSPSRISYREMALVNMGFAYSQIGDKKNSIEWYERALEEFPESAIATASLRMLNASTVQQDGDSNSGLRPS